VGKGALAPCPPREQKFEFVMPQYRRAKIEGGVFFFTVVLADRDSHLLVEKLTACGNRIDRSGSAARSKPSPFVFCAIISTRSGRYLPATTIFQPAGV
jgi:hypothetical protein